METTLTVREIQPEDIPLIADYWTQSDPDFMVGMGVDLQKLPSRQALTQMLTHQLRLPLPEKASYALIWLVDGKPVGHSNVNALVFGASGYMHLHLWQKELRQRGLGTLLVKKSLLFFFEHLQLQELFCEPYAGNPSPNKTLEKVGFTLEKRYRTTPGSLAFEQEVNRWKMTRPAFEKLLAAACS